MTVACENRICGRRSARVAAAAALGGLALLANVAQAQGVGVRIHMDAESAELIRAWRRAQGLDPPDPAADAQLAERLRQRRGATPPAAAPQSTSPGTNDSH